MTDPGGRFAPDEGLGSGEEVDNGMQAQSGVGHVPRHARLPEQQEMRFMYKALCVLLTAAVCVFCATAGAQTWSNTLYGQEGTASDGYGAIDASGQGPAGDSAHYTNWKYQFGSGSWSGVYSWDGDAWLEAASDGNSSIEVEADIEMYWSETIADNKIYFHLGNPFTATTEDKQAVVTGTYATNNLMYIGISFAGTDKEAGDFESDGSGLTGRVLGGMVGSTDIGGRDISDQSFDIRFLANCNGGAWTRPNNFGVGAHATIPATLWWKPDVLGMTLGTGTMAYQVTIEPPASQPDGNYGLDPLLVTAPVL